MKFPLLILQALCCAGAVLVIVLFGSMAILIGTDVYGKTTERWSCNSEERIRQEIYENLAKDGYGEFYMDKWTGKTMFRHYERRYNIGAEVSR